MTNYDTICTKCSGLIARPGTTYGWGGTFCHCEPPFGSYKDGFEDGRRYERENKPSSDKYFIHYEESGSVDWENLDKPKPMCCLKCIVPTDNRDQNYGCSNVDCICHIEQPQCPHTQTFLVTLPGGKAVERCSACNGIMVVSPQSQPEQWEERFTDQYWEATQGRNDVRREAIRSLLSRQKEQMLEVLRGMKSNIKFARKMVSGGQYTLDSCQGCNQTWSSCVCVERNVGYNSALSDVEEKWKDL